MDVRVRKERAMLKRCGLPPAAAAVAILLAAELQGAGPEPAAPPPAPPEEAAPAAQAQDGKAPFRLGVVNLKTCFDKDKYDRIKEVNAQLKAKRDELLKKIEGLERRIAELKEQRDGLDRQQLLYEEKDRLLRLAQAELEYEKKIGGERYRGHYNDLMIQVYNEINRVVRMIGEEQKYDLVLRVEDPQLEEEDPVSVYQRIQNRVVLYHHDAVDMTALVVERLNQEWTKQQAAAEWECPKCKEKVRDEKCAKCGSKKP
jgi:Skp family chaperone for outer membrane proteins